MIALRARGVGKYFAADIETDGATKPREAMRALLRIAGIERRPKAGRDVQRTLAAAGHVLRDVSLEIAAGSVVCLAGPSGSGKSVLLRVLAGVTAPTRGSVELYAPVTPLLSIGANLDAGLTARENIAVSPVVGTMSAAEASRHAAEVIDFAELHSFEDAPIRTYSTGMVLRLSVALALCGRPSIVLIDDVLGVGDIGFQQKCIDRVHALKDAGCTLVLALADEALVRQLATRVLTLHAGRIVSDQRPEEWTTVAATSGVAGVTWHITQNLPENDVMALRAVVVAPSGDDARPELMVRVTFDVKVGGARCRPAMTVARPDGPLFRSVYPEFVAADRPGPIEFALPIPMSILPDGDYFVAVGAAVLVGDAVFALKSNDTVTLEIRRERAAGPTPATAPLLALDFPWEVEQVEA